MSSEQNKSIVRRLFEEGMNEKNVMIFDQFISPSYTNPMFPGVSGPEGMKQVLHGFYTAFPDMVIHLEEVIGEGDTVATKGHFTGTNSGSFMGMPASGKKVKVSYMDFWKLKDGKCVENWVQMDIAGLMQQIGAAPEPAM